MSQNPSKGLREFFAFVLFVCRLIKLEKFSILPVLTAHQSLLLVMGLHSMRIEREDAGVLWGLPWGISAQWFFPLLGKAEED
jgi:hypothetical protein